LPIINFLPRLGSGLLTLCRPQLSRFRSGLARVGLRSNKLDAGYRRTVRAAQRHVVKNKNGGAAFSYGEARRYLEALP
jgi:hypothetical protein